MDILKKIWAYFIPYKTVIFVTFLMGLAMTALNMVNPYITKIILDKVIVGGESSLLVPLLALMAAQTVIRHSIQYFRSYKTEKYSQQVTINMRNDAFRKFLSMTFDFYNREKTGHLLTLLSSDIEIVKDLIKGTIPAVIEMAISFVFASAILISMNLPLTLICYLVLPFTFFLTKKYSREIRLDYTAIREQSAQLSTVAQENINGVRVIRAFAREGFESDKFRSENQRYMDVHMAMRKTWAKNYWKIAAAANFPYIMILLAGGIFTVRGSMTLGEFVAFGSYIGFLMNPINSISAYVSAVQNAMASGEKLFAFLSRIPDIRSPGKPALSGSMKGDILFSGVSLSFEENRVLQDIDIEIPAGRKIGIMGETGCGKTSIANLIGRYYDCSAGKVTVDGVNIKKVDLSELRRNIAYVMQDIFLFSDSIASNVAFGRSDAGDEEIVQTAVSSKANDFIRRMPEGYETVIGERGIGLSGGQKQRIAIARALLTNKKIMIFDDSTSSLDMETEHSLLDNLSRLLKGRTQIMISNRISAVMDSDEILFMKEGRIVERGTHSELLERDGLYAEIYNEQYGQGKTDLAGGRP